MLLRDVYSEIKINLPEMQTATAPFLSATKLAGNVLHDSEQMLGQHREHKLETSDQMHS